MRKRARAVAGWAATCILHEDIHFRHTTKSPLGIHATQAIVLGVRVELTGLSAELLNGQRGVVCGAQLRNGRWPVQLEQDWQEGPRRSVSVHTANMAVVVGTCDHCGVQKQAAVLVTCARCRHARYCTVQCRSRAAATHGEECREPLCCTICLDNEDTVLPMQCGCGCREEAGAAHLQCKIRAAEHHGNSSDDEHGEGGTAQGVQWNAAWNSCLTCKQLYTGDMRLGLAEEAARQFDTRPARDMSRLLAQANLANALLEHGRSGAAETLSRNHLATCQRVLGGEHPVTLMSTSELAAVLNKRGSHKAAESMYRKVVKDMKRVLGSDEPATLVVSSDLARVLHSRCEYAAAEALFREVLAMRKQVFGREHGSTLATANVR